MFFTALVLCFELPPIVNGSITYAPDNVSDFEIGTVATYVCDPGFILVGDMTRVCSVLGLFNGEAPFCQRKDFFDTVGYGKRADLVHNHIFITSN